MLGGGPEAPRACYLCLLEYPLTKKQLHVWFPSHWGLALSCSSGQPPLHGKAQQGLSGWVRPDLRALSPWGLYSPPVPSWFQSPGLKPWIYMSRTPKRKEGIEMYAVVNHFHPVGRRFLKVFHGRTVMDRKLLAGWGQKGKLKTRQERGSQKPWAPLRVIFDGCP